ncbi:MAG: hypothetical protein KDA69_19150 [Planctomycetaceae bacterium]|nr:hypothetical protein [Planctomycetaceae bacterium]MCA9046452.1 hypothetical protein [Planctomycetaceae bacterium]
MLDWQQRLAVVEQRLATDVEEDWLDHVRAKILRYFIARYGHEPGSRPTVPPNARAIERREPTIRSVEPRHSSRPLSGEAMRHLLLDIHERVQRATYGKVD